MCARNTARAIYCYGELEILEFLCTDILTGYFYCWRPYRLIVARLRAVHGIRRRFVLGIELLGREQRAINPVYSVPPTVMALLYHKIRHCSLRWLKQEFRRLNVHRRKNNSLTPVAIVRNNIQV